MTEQSPQGEPGRTEAMEPMLIFSCSGASAYGQITDLAARQLDAERAGRMSCIAGIGGGVEKFIVAAQASPAVLVIDGCANDCAKLALASAGVAEKITHIRVTDLDKDEPHGGMTKVRIERVIEKAKEKLAS